MDLQQIVLMQSIFFLPFMGLFGPPGSTIALTLFRPRLGGLLFSSGSGSSGGALGEEPFQTHP